MDKNIVKRLEVVKAANQRLTGLFTRVWHGKATRNQAIKAMCIQCFGYETTGVAECGDFLCPLWHFRPYRKRLKTSTNDSPVPKTAD